MKRLSLQEQKLIKERLNQSITWSKSCVTLKQLKTVDDYINRISKRLHNTNYHVLTYYLGLASGVVLQKNITLNEKRNDGK